MNMFQTKIDLTNKTKRLYSFFILFIFIVINFKSFKFTITELFFLVLCKLLYLAFYFIILKIIKMDVRVHKKIIIEDFLFKSDIKKILILFIKVIYFFITFIITKNFSNKYLLLFSKTNLIFLLLNFLPITPMFLGNILSVAISKFVGDIKAIKIMNKISFFFSYLIIFAGFIFIIFYPYRIHLLIFGFYIKFINSDKHYLELLVCNLFKKEMNREVNIFYVNRSLTVKEVVEKIKFNKYNVFCIKKKNNYIVITEETLKEEVLKNNMEVKIEDIFKQ